MFRFDFQTIWGGGGVDLFVTGRRHFIERALAIVQQCNDWERSGLSCRVLDLRPKGRGFELHRCHCVVVLEQDTFIQA